MTDRLKDLSDAGVSIWLDDLSRNRLDSGNLADLIEKDSVVGVTTNPTIFAAALAHGDAYTEQIAALGEVPVATAIKHLCATDVRAACELFAAVYAGTQGFDGRVSIEVEPGLAHDTDATVAQAAELHALVGRDNVLIKIPATPEGLPAITATIASGISVNVTLIFSVERYRAVMDAYLAGLERAAAAGRDLSAIHSVASFFISRVDTEVDRRLEAAGHPELAGKAAIANAEVALGAYAEVFGSDRFAALAARGANVQRPLWASTGTKNPAYPDTLYVGGLVARGVVNTMPEKTLQAFADHGEVGPRVEGRSAPGQAVLDAVAAAGVDLDEVYAVLEDEGVDKFVASWDELVASVEAAQAKLR
ncbi:transaldolase [Propionicimonas sp.]|uniref:transaldolase n=1 Tax=Propionicimonas sp. TaxID=1955623 RepID=UPI0039E71FD9